MFTKAKRDAAECYEMFMQAARSEVLQHRNIVSLCEDALPVASCATRHTPFQACSSSILVSIFYLVNLRSSAGWDVLYTNLGMRVSFILW
jgi:hypothetical protein